MFLTGNIKTEQIGDMHKLLEDVVYQDGDAVYTVPAGYLTDFASIPRALGWMYPKSGPYNKAAIVHDWLITDLLPTGQITSIQVDATFREAMSYLDIPKARQWVMWAGVRLGAIGNKKRRKGSWKTLPKVLFVILLALPAIAVPSVVVELWLLAMAFVSMFLPKRHKITAQKA